MNNPEHDPLESELARALSTRAAAVDPDVSNRLFTRLSPMIVDEQTRISRRGRTLATVGLTAALLALVALIPVIVSTTTDSGERRAESTPLSSTPAATTRPLTLAGESLDGGSISTADYLGQPLVLIFWGSWCEPCRDQAKDLAGTAGIQILGVSAKENIESARAFETEADLSFQTLYQANEQTAPAMTPFTSAGTPITVLLDSQGRMAKRWQGRVATSTVLDEIERLQSDQQVVLLAARSGSSGRNAIIGGPLTLVGNCAGIGDKVAVWPYGTTLVSESPLTLDVPGMGKVEAGESLTGAGGFFDTATDDVPIRIPASCGTTRGVGFRVE